MDDHLVVLTFEKHRPKISVKLKERCEPLPQKFVFDFKDMLSAHLHNTQKRNSVALTELPTLMLTKN